MDEVVVANYRPADKLRVDGEDVSGLFATSLINVNSIDDPRGYFPSDERGRSAAVSNNILAIAHRYTAFTVYRV